MQIREKGKKLLCIRTVYVPEKKRTVGVTVASQERWLTTVSEEVCQQLKKEEVDQLEKWLSDRKEKENVVRLEYSLLFAADQMEKAAEALTVDGLEKDLSERQVAEIWQAHENLSKALKKAGYKKPAKAKGQTKNKTVDNQEGLPFDTEKKQ